MKRFIEAQINVPGTKVTNGYHVIEKNRRDRLTSQRSIRKTISKRKTLLPLVCTHTNDYDILTQSKLSLIVGEHECR